MLDFIHNEYGLFIFNFENSLSMFVSQFNETKIISSLTGKIILPVINLAK